MFFLYVKRNTKKTINNYMNERREQIFGTNRAMSCTACGTTGIKPRMTQMEDKFFVYTEAKYICSRCGQYFHKGAVSKIAKNTEES